VDRCITASYKHDCSIEPGLQKRSHAVETSREIGRIFHVLSRTIERGILLHYS
jgi:hypothetical protein